MDVFEAIKTRRSIRAFKPEPVSGSIIDQIIEAGIAAPSAGNMQPRLYFQIDKQDLKERLADAAWGQSFIADAPVVLIVCADVERSAARYGERGRRFYSLLDTAASIQNILLCAHSLNLGACWVGAFDDNRVRGLLNLPDHIRPVAIIPIGYPAETPRPTPRDHPRKVTFTSPYR